MKQLYEVDDTFTLAGTDFVVTGVTYREDEAGERSAFTYQIRTADELEAERKVQAEIDRRQAEAEAAAQEEADLHSPEKTEE